MTTHDLRFLVVKRVVLTYRRLHAIYQISIHGRHSLRDRSRLCLFLAGCSGYGTRRQTSFWIYSKTVSFHFKRWINIMQYLNCVRGPNVVRRKKNDDDENFNFNTRVPDDVSVNVSRGLFSAFVASSASTVRLRLLFIFLPLIKYRRN